MSDQISISTNLTGRIFPEITAKKPLNPADNPESPETGSDPADTYKTSITPLIDGERIFPAARGLIQNAKKSVALEMYEFGNREVDALEEEQEAKEAKNKDQEALLGELIAARKRGVEVQVILDGSLTGSGNVHNERIANHLKANGVKVINYPVGAAKIDHVKLLVVDGNRALIGGMNWGTHSPSNHDADVLIKGREAAELKDEVFDPSAKFSGIKPSPTYVNPDRQDKIKVAQTIPSSQDGGSSTLKEAILENINSAEKSVHAELFVLSDSDVVDSIKKAHKRGIDVKIILDPSQHNTNKKSFNELKRAGVQVKWFSPAKASQKLHAKWGTFDKEKTIIGSGNWSFSGLTGSFHNPSSKTNKEADVIITDKSTTNIFEKTFSKDWDNHTSDELPFHTDYQG